MKDVLHQLEGLHTERNSLGGRFTERSYPWQGYYHVERPELRARLVRLTREISALESEYASRLSYVVLDTGKRGYTCPRCGSRVQANECGTAFAYVENDSTAIGCCEDCMIKMLTDRERRVQAALKNWRAT